ncbi:MAG: alpha-isopropylmalate synthase regulatory domain-containing protein [Patescibacteria group bacterium]|jgi:2-isopropylmalate synthase
MRTVGFSELGKVDLVGTGGNAAVVIAETLIAGTFNRDEAVSLGMWMARMEPGYVPPFMVKKYRVIEAHEPPDAGAVTATIMLQYEGEDHHVAGDGDGPINALDNALRKVVGACVNDLVLGDYHVVVRRGQESGSAVRVQAFVDWEFGDWHFRTTGVATSVVEASWIAMVDAFEFIMVAGVKLPTR